MQAFSEYLTEKKTPAIAGHGVLSDSGSHGKYHHGKYYSHEARGKHKQKFTLAYDVPEVGKAGTEHEVDDVKERDGKYYGVVKGKEVRMKNFHKPKTAARVGSHGQKLEVSQVDKLDSAVQDRIKKNGGKPIKMLLNKKVVNVVAVKRVEEGTPKADAYCVDEKGKPNHWMSLKGDTFQQWAGIDKRSLGDHAESATVKDAIEKLKGVKDAIAPDSEYLPSSSAYHVDMDTSNPEHRRLINLSTFGPDFGKEHGRNNVHAIYGGDTIDLESFQHPKHGEVHKFVPKAYYENSNNEKADTPESKFLLTNRAAVSQKGTGGRIMIVPKSFMEGSRSHEVTKEPGYKHVPAITARKAETAERNAAKKAEKAAARDKANAEKHAARAKAAEEKIAAKKAKQKPVEKLGNDGTIGGMQFREKEAA